MRKFRETLRSGEAFALKQMPAADIMSLLCADPVPPNEEIDGGIVVHVRGPLEHHSTPFCDNYDDLYARFCEAAGCAAEKDWCVVLKIDSPGGLVSGLNETVYAMQEEAREHGVDVIVYVDELAASAAYAMSCVGDEIVVPPSGIVGSVGVISAMTSLSKANEKAGIDVVTLTSGARKSDGHPDVPISDEAIAVEQSRVDDLAAQFFALVEEARGVDASKYEAALFLGKKAVKAGLADRVANWPQLLVDIAADYGSGTEVAQDGTVPGRATGDPMNLKALITRAEKALAAEKDPKKRQALATDIATFRAALSAGTKKTYKKMEEQRTEESDDAEEEAEGGNETDREEEGDEDKKEASSHRAESNDDKDGDDKKESRSAESEEEEEASSEEDEASAEDDKDEEEALTALVAGLKGRKAQRAMGTLRALIANARVGVEAGQQVRQLRADRARDALHATIDGKLAKRFITAKEAQWLKGQPKATVDSFLKMRKAPIVLGDEEILTPPNGGTGIEVPQGSAVGQLGPQQMAVLEAAARGAGVPVESLIKQYKPTLPNGIKTGGN